jgi:predicted O-methyltransferase YrrM
MSLFTLLPGPVRSRLRDALDHRRLAALPSRELDLAALRSGDALALAAIFNDRGIEDTWRLDHESLRDIHGERDKTDGVNPGDRRALYYLVRALGPRRVLEIGTHIGASTLYIAAALKRNGGEGRVVTVDIADVNDPQTGAWKAQGLELTPRDFARQRGCLEHIEFVREAALSFMRRAPERYGLIFLDGDHMAHAVYAEVAAALRLLEPGGVIVLHDYYPDEKPLFPDGNVIRGPVRALDRLRREAPGLSVRSLSPLPWPTKQGSHATSLAVVLRA